MHVYAVVLVPYCVVVHMFVNYDSSVGQSYIHVCFGFITSISTTLLAFALTKQHVCE